MWFFTDEKPEDGVRLTRLVCDMGCRGQADVWALRSSDIPDGVFCCDDCGEAFLVYDGRVFMEVQ